MHNFLGTHFAGGANLAFTLHNGDHVTAHGLSDVHKHKAYRPAANDGNSIANLHSRLMQSPQYASKGLNHRCFFEAYMWRNHQGVQINDAARNTNVLGVSSVVEQEVFAEVFLVTRTVEAGLAWRGVQRHHPHALLKSADP